MTNYTLAADRGTGSHDIYKVGEYLKQCAGGNVKVLGIGPSVLANHGLHAGKGTIGVYMTNGVGLATPNDFNLGCKPGSYYKYDKVIFVWPQWINNQWMSNENIVKHVVKGEWDWNRSQSYNVGGQTAAQWFPKAQYVDLVSGSSPQDVAQRICSGAFVTESGNPTSPTSSSASSASGSGQYGSSSSANGSSGSSPLLEGQMTFEELVKDICDGIDLSFLVKKSTVVVEDFESIFAEAKYLRDNHSSTVEGENIKLWQLEEDSYELEINQHGFYNTVYVKYKNGTVKESYDEYVRVFGEIPITYKDPKVDKTTAIMKAKAYLSAHVRDFEMHVNASILADGDIDIGDIVTLENPKTFNNKARLEQKRDPEYLFVNGVSVSWEEESPITNDVELMFAPPSPQRKEVPSSGTATGTNASSSGGGTGGAGGTYGKTGLSADGSTICAIGRPSAAGESSYGYTFYRSVFVNKCPFCGQSKLVWGIFWAGNETSNTGYFAGKGSSEGGSADGHVFCGNCDADFSCILGRDHMSPPRAALKRADSGPVKVPKSDAYKLKQGIYSF